MPAACETESYTAIQHPFLTQVFLETATLVHWYIGTWIFQGVQCWMDNKAAPTYQSHHPLGFKQNFGRCWCIGSWSCYKIISNISGVTVNRFYNLELTVDLWTWTSGPVPVDQCQWTMFLFFHDFMNYSRHGRVRWSIWIWSLPSLRFYI